MSKSTVAAFLFLAALLGASIAAVMPQTLSPSQVVGGQDSDRTDVTPKPTKDCVESCTQGGVPCGDGFACQPQPFTNLCNEAISCFSAKCVAGDVFIRCETGGGSEACITRYQGRADSDGDCYCNTEVSHCGVKLECNTQ